MTFQHDISDMAINHPYIAIIEDGETQQIFLVVERIVMSSCESFYEALWGLISVYFVFDILYPKFLHATLIFIQHLVMDVKDSQTFPPVANRIYSSLQVIKE